MYFQSKEGTSTNNTFSQSPPVLMKNRWITLIKIATAFKTFTAYHYGTVTSGVRNNLD